MFLGDGIGAAVAALFGHARVVTDTVQADLEIRAALGASFRAAGRTRQLVFGAAVPTMSRHCHAGHFRVLRLALTCSPPAHSRGRIGPDVESPAARAAPPRS